MLNISFKLEIRVWNSGCISEIPASLLGVLLVDIRSFCYNAFFQFIYSIIRSFVGIWFKWIPRIISTRFAVWRFIWPERRGGVVAEIVSQSWLFSPVSVAECRVLFWENGSSSKQRLDSEQNYSLKKIDVRFRVDSQAMLLNE